MWLNDRYKLLNLIGSGGMSKVYLAFDKIKDCLCAIKILDKQNSQHSYKTVLQTYQNEIIHLSLLNHTKISHRLDVFEDSEAFYLVLNYIDGISLTSYFHHQTRLHMITDMMLQTLDILQYIHARGIYHLDIKPQNFLVKQHCIYLIDFGSSFHVNGSRNTQYVTPAYAAKEIIEGKRPDASCDVYSFGITFYVLLFGCFPVSFQYSTPMAKFLLTCSATDKKSRYQNIKETKQGLYKLLL